MRAPARIQAPSAVRSDGVIPVAFPSGITCESTATRSMSEARALICAAVSSSIPRGAAETRVGCAEWQGTQRSSTIDCARANGTVAAAAAQIEPPPQVVIAMATTEIPAAAVTRIHHAFRPA